MMKMMRMMEERRRGADQGAKVYTVLNLSEKLFYAFFRENISLCDLNMKVPFLHIQAVDLTLLF